ncbi:hypothetical protein L1049_008616 [Liquidambar formosana]|uniref:tRNA-splicing endonuclease subunit Sen54 N-terminal domain-containing protein n=1 Tax=Liquidambar formosana TaxID=63359 RepID=A0AAP0SA38_LIQFO
MMEAEDWASSSGEMSDTELNLQDTNDEDCHLTSGSISKLQFRKDISKARWNDEMGMAEVVKKKGQLWTTTGIVRSSKTYCSIEETLFLAEVGALLLLDDNDISLSLRDIYVKVAEGKGGCSWEDFEVYRHLKSLGYIVGRHGIPWTMKSVKSSSSSVSLQGTPEGSKIIERESEDKSSIGELFNNMQINELRPVFDVYLPNSKFRKSSPGDPSFVLCPSSGYPPSKAVIEVMERRCSGIPLKFSHVDHGRVSFFSFNKVDLPVLP